MKTLHNRLTFISLETGANIERKYQLSREVGLKKSGLISKIVRIKINLPRRIEKEEMCAFRNIVRLFSTWNSAFNFLKINPILIILNIISYSGNDINKKICLKMGVYSFWQSIVFCLCSVLFT